MASAAAPEPSALEWKKLMKGNQELQQDVLTGKGLESSDDVKLPRVSEEGLCEGSEKEEGKNEGPGLEKNEGPVEELANGGITPEVCSLDHFVVAQPNVGLKKSEESKSLTHSDVRLIRNLSGKQDCMAVVSDLEKKQRRAERFGVDVKMSENEKRKLRATRFGAASGFVDKDSGSFLADSAKTSPMSKETEEEKRKARAARFGVSEPIEKVPYDEVAKKRARIARFVSLPDLKTDFVSEEKKKAREARFGVAATEETLGVEKKFQKVETVAHV